MADQLMDPMSVFNQGVELRQQGKLDEAKQAFIKAANLFYVIHGSQKADMRVHIARAVGAASSVSAEAADRIQRA